jgi:transposase
VVIRIERTPKLAGCPGCGVVARAHGRMVVDYGDLAAFGPAARLRWRKRRFRCEEPAWELGTWTETSPAFSSRCLPTTAPAWSAACRWD